MSSRYGLRPERRPRPRSGSRSNSSTSALKQTCHPTRRGSTGCTDRRLSSYRYRDGREERLRLGAELFHLLLELGDGYQLGDTSTDDTFAHLDIFVQRLEREDDRRLLAWNPMRDDTIHEVSAEYGEHGGRQRIAIRSLT